jgi:hypothetical protein
MGSAAQGERASGFLMKRHYRSGGVPGKRRAARFRWTVLDVANIVANHSQ